MLGMNDNVLATMVLVIFVVYMCMHSSHALKGGSKSSARNDEFRRCRACGFAVEPGHAHCPHCAAKMEDPSQQDVMA